MRIPLSNVTCVSLVQKQSNAALSSGLLAHGQAIMLPHEKLTPLVALSDSLELSADIKSALARAKANAASVDLQTLPTVTGQKIGLGNGATHSHSRRVS